MINTHMSLVLFQTLHTSYSVKRDTVFSRLALVMEEMRFPLTELQRKERAVMSQMVLPFAGIARTEYAID